MIHSSPSRSASGLQAGEVAAGAGLAEELAADDVAAVHLLQVALLDLLGGVGVDRRRDHAEADAEEALVGDLVLRLDRAEDAVVGRGELAAAELGRGR